MEEIQKPDSHITSAAAFVKGGIQDACDDACSICLEEFSESDPSTVIPKTSDSFLLTPFLVMGILCSMFFHFYCVEVTSI